jgi:hypothetical protein
MGATSLAKILLGNINIIKIFIAKNKKNILIFSLFIFFNLITSTSLMVLLFELHLVTWLAGSLVK